MAQQESLPRIGLHEFRSYQSSAINHVDLGSGNVYLHIPIISPPQRGGKLRLNFIARLNQPQWTVNALKTNSIYKYYDWN